ncbi:MAG TPA: diacylglycerol kinase family protein [Kofleriaceae bacterium]|nr:diacylglycerol kinase family protein [Kofleriaceae bacterium]
MKVAIVLNARAGTLDREQRQQRADEILAACRQRGIDASTHLCEGARLTETARMLARRGDLDAVVAAGGDGTVSAVAAGVVGTGVPLGVIPLGTLNHFAKDLGIRDVDTAIDAIARGETQPIDVGEVNGRVFINNSSIGLYPEIVVQRDEERQAKGTGKWRAMLRAAWRILVRFPLLHVAIALAGKVFSAKTPVVFVGNNEYEVNVLATRSLGVRKQINRGVLAVYTMRTTSRLKMLWVALKELLQEGEPPELEMHTVDRADIVATKRSLEVAIDGEVVRMRPPLAYRSRPGALRVFIPPSLREPEAHPA